MKLGRCLVAMMIMRLEKCFIVVRCLVTMLTITLYRFLVGTCLVVMVIIYSPVSSRNAGYGGRGSQFRLLNFFMNTGATSVTVGCVVTPSSAVITVGPFSEKKKE